METTIVFTPDGCGHCFYNEEIDLHRIGKLSIRRASRIEFNPANQCWEVYSEDLEKVVFSSPSRDRCVAWEHENLPLPV